MDGEQGREPKAMQRARCMSLLIAADRASNENTVATWSFGFHVPYRRAISSGDHTKVYQWPVTSRACESNCFRRIMGTSIGGYVALSREQLNALARHGAQTRVNELRQEIAAIEQAFPDLRSRRGGRRRKRAAGGASAGEAESAGESGTVKRRGRRGWSASQRKAAADRMRAYWAKRKGTRKK